MAKRNSKKTKTIKKVMNDVQSKLSVIDFGDHIIFDGNMRKMLVEGILQDIKGYIENKTDGLVEILYEDHNLKNHEFGFRLYVTKGLKCKRQMFNEATSAIVSAINYMFQGDDEQYDIGISSDEGKLEVEFVSKW